jgi:prolyl-tRNA synthetase
LYKRAKQNLDKSVSSVKSYEEFKKIVKDKGGFVKASWCGETHCELQIKDETSATIRIIPFKKEKVSKCIYCNKAGKETVYFARAY